MKPLGQTYVDAQESTDFVQLPPDGYICIMQEVLDHSDEEKPYLEIVYDIADGEYVGFYSDEWGRDHKQAHSVRQYYTEKSMGVFKGFIKAVNESNNTDFDPAVGFNETQMEGLLIGLVIGKEWYNADDGTDKYFMKVFNTKSVKSIQEGKFKAPEDRWRKGHEPSTNTSNSNSVTDEEIASVFG